MVINILEGQIVLYLHESSILFNFIDDQCYGGIYAGENIEKYYREFISIFREDIIEVQYVIERKNNITISFISIMPTDSNLGGITIQLFPIPQTVSLLNI